MECCLSTVVHRFVPVQKWHAASFRRTIWQLVKHAGFESLQNPKVALRFWYCSTRFASYSFELAKYEYYQMKIWEELHGLLNIIYVVAREHLKTIRICQK